MTADRLATLRRAYAQSGAPEDGARMLCARVQRQDGGLTTERVRLAAFCGSAGALAWSAAAGGCADWSCGEVCESGQDCPGDRSLPLGLDQWLRALERLAGDILGEEVACVRCKGRGIVRGTAWKNKPRVDPPCKRCNGTGKDHESEREWIMHGAAVAAGWVACERDEHRKGWVAKRVKRRKRRGRVWKLVPHGLGLITRDDKPPAVDLASRLSLEAAEHHWRTRTTESLRAWEVACVLAESLEWLLTPWSDHAETTLAAADATYPEVAHAAISSFLIPWMLK